MTSKEVSQLKQMFLSCMCVWGDPGTGKSMFALGTPYKPKLHIDTEKGTMPYRMWPEIVDGTEFMDVRNLKELRQGLAGVKPGQYETIIIDSSTTVGEWVANGVHDEWTSKGKDPEKQGPKYNREVSQNCENLINHCKGLAPLVVITAFSRVVWMSKTGEKEPKLSPGFIRMTDIALQLVRSPNQRVPHGQLPHRNRFLQLPPRLPNITWKVLLEWLAKPPLDIESLEDHFFIPDELMATIQMPNDFSS